MKFYMQKLHLKIYSEFFSELNYVFLFGNYVVFKKDSWLERPCSSAVEAATDFPPAQGLFSRVGRTTMMDKDRYADLENNIIHSYNDICKISGP